MRLCRVPKAVRVAGVVLPAALLPVACSTATPSNGGIRVVAAFYPLAYVAEQVGGTHVDVENLTAPGVEPHDLELTPGQVRDLAEAELVVYLGHGFQPAVEDAIDQLDDDRVLDVLADQELLTREQEEREDVTETVGSSETEDVDPHVWLDPTRMTRIVDDIDGGLQDVEPTLEDANEDRVGELMLKLADLDDAYSDGLAHCVTRAFVTSHAAFGYLADRYDLTQISVSGLDPEAEPSPGRLAEVARLVEERGITTIFTEELAPPEIADTLANETGAHVEVLSPLESAPSSGDYFTAMETNLERLREALGCD